MNYNLDVMKTNPKERYMLLKYDSIFFTFRIIC
jgi:hypothetical protein